MDAIDVQGVVAAGVAIGASLGAGMIYNKFRVSGKVEDTMEKHGGQLVAEVLKAHGVEYIFTLVGGHISPILVSCEQMDIHVVDTRHEVTTVFAADAVARMTGIPGVAAVTAGPGLTNTVTAVKNAQMAESPVVLLGGAAATLLKGRGALQDIDQMALFKPLCKYTATVTKVKDIVPILRRAFQEAQSGVPGPVFVEFPIDTLYPYPMVMKEAVPSAGKPKGILEKVINWYLTNHVKRQFAGAFEPQELSPLPVSVPLGTVSQIQQAADLIRASKRPVVLLGSQATLPPTKPDHLQAALLAMGVPCFLGGMSRGMLGAENPIQVKQKRREALREADLVILAGAVCDFRLGYGRSINRKSKVIAINRDKISLTKNAGVFWHPTLSVLGDVGSFLTAVSDNLALTKYSCSAEWIKTLKDRDVMREKEIHDQGKEPADRFMNPIMLLEHLENMLPSNAILIADGGDFVGTAAYTLRPRGPLTWLDPGAFGTLGVGGGFALGAKLVRPDAEVWIIYGDGSLGYSVAEFDTFARHKAPVIALVGNDACWSQIAREQVPMFKTDVACALAFTDYHTVADGYGGKGYLLDDEDDIDKCFKAAQDTAAAGKPALINALIGKSDFRKGSISV